MPISRIRLLRCNLVTAAISVSNSLRSLRLALAYLGATSLRYFRFSSILILSSLGMALLSNIFT
jgi:hypothetical protein